MNRDRSDELVQHRVQGDKRTFPNQVIGKERSEMTTAEYEMPIYVVETDGPWRTVTYNNRNGKPTRILKTAVTESDCDDFKRRLETVEADRRVDRNEEDKPDSGQAVAVPPGGVSMSATDNRGGRCTDCTKRTMMSGTEQTTGGDFSNSLSGLLPAVVNKLEHKEDAGAMHYQWIVRESIMITEMNMPSNYLEIPELKIPKLFLHLAEEARDVEVNNDISGCTEEVKSQATGLQSQILVTVMTDGQPIPFGNELVNDVVSTKMMNDEKYVGRFKPMDRAYSVVRDVLLTGQLEIVTRSDPVGPHSRQDQSVSLRLNTDQGEHIPTHRVHPGVKMFRAQPVADGPAGPDRSRRPVGTEEIHAVHDDVRPTAGGPVGRLPDPGTLKYRKISSPDDSYQPLFTGPLGTNELDAIVGRRLAARWADSAV